MLHNILKVVGLIALTSATNSTAAQQFRLSDDAAHALVGVIAHEIGHAVIREFDLPILGPEEDMAEDFSVIYIHMMLPEKAGAIVSARARQHLMDGQEARRFSEYRDDDQRADRNICILYGIDPEAYAPVAEQFDLLNDPMASNCRDFPTEVFRSWRRVLRDLWMDENSRVSEVGLFVDPDPRSQALESSEIFDDLYGLLTAIDWHSRITLSLSQCDGTASWSRNGRRITLCSDYIQRFEDQLGS